MRKGLQQGRQADWVIVGLAAIVAIIWVCIFGGVVLWIRSCQWCH